MTLEEVDRICDIMWQMDISNGDIQKVREAFEKQIPKKPIFDFQHSGDFYWYCPMCKEVVLSYIADTPIVNGYNHNYCGGCGQAIDWSDIDDL